MAPNSGCRAHSVVSNQLLSFQLSPSHTNTPSSHSSSTALAEPLRHSLSRAPLEHMYLTLNDHKRRSPKLRLLTLSSLSNHFVPSADNPLRSFQAPPPLRFPLTFNVPDAGARWAGPPSPIGWAKRRRVWSDPALHTWGRPCSLNLRSRGRRFCRPFGVACRGRKKKKSRRWSAGGERWRRYNAGEWCKMEALLRIF